MALIVERGMEGFTKPLRPIINGSLTRIRHRRNLIFDNVRFQGKIWLTGKWSWKHHWVVWILPLRDSLGCHWAQQWMFMIPLFKVRQRTYTIREPHCRLPNSNKKIGGDD